MPSWPNAMGRPLLRRGRRSWRYATGASSCRVRARLPAPAQRRGRDAAASRRQPSAMAMCCAWRSSTATGRRCTTCSCTPRSTGGTTSWACGCPRRCSASSPSRLATASGASSWAGRAGPGGRVVTASSPITIHLGQFARGYTAMIAAAYGSAWLMLVLLRTGRPAGSCRTPWRRCCWWRRTRSACSRSSPSWCSWPGSAGTSCGTGGGQRPAGDRGARRRRSCSAPRRSCCCATCIRRSRPSTASAAGARSSSSASSRFWERLGDARTGLAACRHSGIARGRGRAARHRVARVPRPPGGDRRRRCGSCCRCVLLSILTASSEDFAPERHLSFLLPGYAVALAGFALELRRLPGRGSAPGSPRSRARRAARAGLGGRPERARELQRQPARRQPRTWRGEFGRTMSSRRRRAPLGQREDPRLVGAYAVLAAPDSSPLAAWQHGRRRLRGCRLVRRLGQRRYPQRVWLMMSVPSTRSTWRPALRRAGADVHGFGTFLVARRSPAAPHADAGAPSGRHAPVAPRSPSADPAACDVRRMARLYRHAAHLDSAQLCPRKAT